jgi:hypothetical protein
VDINSEAGQAIQAEVHALDEKQRALDAAAKAQENATKATEEGNSAARDFAGTLVSHLTLTQGYWSINTGLGRMSR